MWASASIGIVAWRSKCKDLYGKKPIVFVTYENESISIKNGLRNMRQTLCRENTVYSTTHKTAINRPMDHTGETLTHILCKVSSFLLKAFHFRGFNTETIGFCPIQIPGGGGGLPWAQEHSPIMALDGLYRYVPLWRVWFSSSLLWDRVYKSESLGLE